MACGRPEYGVVLVRSLTGDFNGPADEVSEPVAPLLWTGERGARRKRRER